MAHFEITKVISRSADGFKAQVIVDGRTKHLHRIDGTWIDQPNEAGFCNTYTGGGL